MKKLILMIITIIPLTTFAYEPIKLEGRYYFDDAEALQARDVELVPTMNTARYKELVKDQYACSIRGDFFMCQKHLKTFDLPVVIKADIVKAWNEKYFSFEPSTLFPVITNESISLLEWDIFDSVFFEESKVAEYHYYLIKGESDLHKIVLNFSTGQKWLVINSEKMMTMPIQKRERISPFKSRVYEIMLSFTRL